MRKVLRILTILVCLAAPLLTAVATAPMGVALSSDSAYYISTAQSIVHGRGATDFNGHPTTLWPPFYPFLLALVHQITSIEFTTSALLVNMLLYSLSIALVRITFEKYTNEFVASLTCVSAAVFFSVFKLSLWALSEILFITLTLCLFVAIDAYIRYPSFSRLIVLALLTALLCITRYSGMAIIGATILFLVFTHRSSSLSFIAIRIIAYSIISILPLMLYLVRNTVLTGMPFGVRSTTIDTFEVNFDRMVDTLANWIFPINYLFFGTRTTVAVLMVIAILFFRYFVLMLQKLISMPKLMLYLVTFSAVYTAFVFMVSVTVAIDPLNWRLLSPVAFPLLILAIYIGWVLFRLAVSERNKVAYTLPAFLVLWIAINGFLVADFIYFTRENGLDYSNRLWQDNAIIKFLRENDVLSYCQAYSNNPAAVYLFLQKPALFTLFKTYYRSLQTASELNDSWLTGREGCVVWFAESFDVLYTLEELKTTADFTPIIELESGGVYKVRKRAAP